MQDIVQWDDGSWPDGLPKKGGANALSGAGSLDTATTCLSKASRTKNFIIEFTSCRRLCPRRTYDRIATSGSCDTRSDGCGPSLFGGRATSGRGRSQSWPWQHAGRTDATGYSWHSGAWGGA